MELTDNDLSSGWLSDAGSGNFHAADRLLALPRCFCFARRRHGSACAYALERLRCQQQQLASNNSNREAEVGDGAVSRPTSQAARRGGVLLYFNAFTLAAKFQPVRNQGKPSQCRSVPEHCNAPSSRQTTNRPKPIQWTHFATSHDTRGTPDQGTGRTRQVGAADVVSPAPAPALSF
ncbi:hypothetical protein BDY21DRAFT_120024 [Lineolata rhizophorae]|uniref:Uncharacterized protein n=1 Tax=Lineolata rhizophorae TaxID=578093 RepID=A0A6A6NQZ1_9PEZI|nr:hypothetical protein BDY21DRAFT_120024 [Lineolata rhizophorae]